MFNSYYCNDEKQARPIQELIEAFSQTGTEGINVACSGAARGSFIWGIIIGAMF